MPWELSSFAATWATSNGAKKLGQPVPELNLFLLAKRGRPHTTQQYVPSFLLSSSVPQKAGSVPAFWVMR
jgi:hypothetical protein